MGGFSSSASTGGGGGSGPAGRKSDGSYGTKRDAKKASRRNELRTAIKNFEPLPVKIIKSFVKGQKKSKQNVLDYEGQAAGVTPERKPMPTTNNGGGDGNNQGIEVANQTGSLTAQTQQAAVDAAPDGPTNIEMPEETEAERLLRIKRQGRRATILNVPDEELTLSKKILLG